jgi:hypothetical protein
VQARANKAHMHRLVTNMLIPPTKEQTRMPTRGVMFATVQTADIVLSSEVVSIFVPKVCDSFRRRQYLTVQSRAGTN